jgi:hypothetical protein
MRTGGWLGLAIALAGMSSAAASEIRLQSRSYVDSCGYYSHSAADFSFNYRDISLPWGSRVSIIYGFGGYHSSPGPNSGGYSPGFEWADRNEVEATAIAPYTWGVAISKTLHERSSDRFLDAIQFIVRIRLPDGREVVEHGNDSPGGFLTSSFQFLETSDCVDQDHPVPDLQDAQIDSVFRN